MTKRKALPSKKTLRSHADRLWSRAVRNQWGRCAIGGSGKIEAHHLLARQHETTRYVLKNGIALSTWNHNYNPDVAPHCNAAGWLEWLDINHYSLKLWYLHEHRNRVRNAFKGTINKTYLLGVIRDLKQHVSKEELADIVGVNFAKWLDDN